MIELPVLNQPRCRGACCKGFTLSVKLEEIRANPERFQDAAYLLDMLIPLGADADGDERFNCRHHNAETGDCMAYEQRPDVCRRHGALYRCKTPGCELGAAWDHESERYARAEEMEL